MGNTLLYPSKTGEIMDSEKILTQLATLIAQGRWMAQEIAELKADVKNLNAFKFKIIGMAALVIAAIEIARASKG